MHITNVAINQTFSYLKRLGYIVLRTTHQTTHQANVPTLWSTALFPLTAQFIQYCSYFFSKALANVKRIWINQFVSRWPLQCTKIRPLLPRYPSLTSYGKPVFNAMYTIFEQVSLLFLCSICIFNIANYPFIYLKICGSTFKIHFRFQCLQTFARLEKDRSWNAGISSICLQVRLTILLILPPFTSVLTKSLQSANTPFPNPTELQMLLERNRLLCRSVDSKATEESSCVISVVDGSEGICSFVRFNKGIREQVIPNMNKVPRS